MSLPFVDKKTTRGPNLGIGTSGVSRAFLVGGWTNPFETYDRQISSFPQVGVNIKNVWNHHPVSVFSSYKNHPNGTRLADQNLMHM